MPETYQQVEKERNALRAELAKLKAQPVQEPPPATGDKPSPTGAKADAKS